MSYIQIGLNTPSAERGKVMWVESSPLACTSAGTPAAATAAAAAALRWRRFTRRCQRRQGLVGANMRPPRHMLPKAPWPDLNGETTDWYSFRTTMTRSAQFCQVNAGFDVAGCRFDSHSGLIFVQLQIIVSDLDVLRLIEETTIKLIIDKAIYGLIPQVSKTLDLYSTLFLPKKGAFGILVSFFV